MTLSRIKELESLVSMGAHSACLGRPFERACRLPAKSTGTVFNREERKQSWLIGSQPRTRYFLPREENHL
jgi:hypothetical protein